MSLRQFILAVIVGLLLAALLLWLTLARLLALRRIAVFQFITAKQRRHGLFSFLPALCQPRMLANPVEVLPQRISQFCEWPRYASRASKISRTSSLSVARWGSV